METARGRRRLLRALGIGALAVALPPLASCEDGGGDTDEFTVKMTDELRFEPERLTVSRGATVTWRNAGRLPHTATADSALAVDRSNVRLPAGAQPWDSGLIDAGKRWSHRFETPGEYTYFCIPHETAGMIGRITVAG